MTWTTPKTWVTGDVLTASDMNTYVRDNTNYLNTQVGSAPILAGSDTTERTTTAVAPGTTWQVTVSIPSTASICVELSYRKSTGGAYSASVGVSTVADSSATHMLGTVTDASNRVNSGYLQVWIPPRYADYTYSARWLAEASHDGSTYVQYHGAGFTQRGTGTVTRVDVNAQVGNAAITAGIYGIKVWAYP